MAQTFFNDFQILVTSKTVKVPDKLYIPRAYTSYCSVVSACLPISMYNLKSNQLQFTYRVATESTNRQFLFNIPLQHYNSSELSNAINWTGQLAGTSSASQFFSCYNGSTNLFQMLFLPSAELTLFALLPGVLQTQLGFTVAVNDTAVPAPLPPLNGLGTPWAASSLTFSSPDHQGRPDLGGFFTTILHDSTNYWNGGQDLSFVQGNFSAPFIASAFLLEGFSPFAAIVYLEGSNDPNTGFVVLGSMTAADQIPNVPAQLAYTCTFYKVLTTTTAYKYYRYQVTSPNYDSLLTVFIAPTATTPLGTYIKNAIVPSTAKSRTRAWQSDINLYNKYK